MEALLPALPAAAPLPALHPRARRRGAGGPRSSSAASSASSTRTSTRRPRACSPRRAGTWWRRPQQGCCGALHLHAGRLDEFRAMARDLMATLGRDVDVIVTNAAGCGLGAQGMRVTGSATTARWAGCRAVRDVTEVLAEAELPLRELPGDGGLSRRLSPRPRAARPRRAARAAAAHPRPHARGSGRERSLLRQRGDLQPARAGDGRRARAAARSSASARPERACWRPAIRAASCRSRGSAARRVWPWRSCTRSSCSAAPSPNEHAARRGSPRLMMSRMTKIRVKDHVEARRRPDGEDRAGHHRAEPARPLLRGRRASRSASTPTTTRTRSTTCSRGAGRFTLGGEEHRLGAGEALVAAAGVEHGLVNDGTDPLLVLVVVAPPPPHMERG